MSTISDRVTSDGPRQEHSPASTRQRRRASTLFWLTYLRHEELTPEGRNALGTITFDRDNDAHETSQQMSNSVHGSPLGVAFGDMYARRGLLASDRPMRMTASLPHRAKTAESR